MPGYQQVTALVRGLNQHGVIAIGAGDTAKMLNISTVMRRPCGGASAGMDLCWCSIFQENDRYKIYYRE
jgi:hypothetical protein